MHGNGNNLLRHSFDGRKRKMNPTEKIPCPDCGGDGRIGNDLQDPNAGQTCETCEGSGEVSQAESDEFIEDAKFSAREKNKGE